MAFDPFHRSLHGRTLRSLRTLRQAPPVMEYFAINLPWLAAGVLVWLGALATYRLYLSPLAKFPGPRLAALTGWYETYYDCMKDGSFWIQIEQFHKQYGRHPISPFRCILRSLATESHGLVQDQSCASARGNYTSMTQTGMSHIR